MDKFNFRVENDESIRLDKFLFDQLKEMSRSQISKIIEQELVQINSKIVLKPSQKIKSGDFVEIIIPEAISDDVIPQEIPLNILFEDKDIIVVNKSSGMVVHPAKGNPDQTLVNALLAHCKDLSGIGGVKRPGIVHRLDKGTSGVMIVAKNDKAHQNLTDQFKKHTVEKIYFALVFGEPKPSHGTIHNLINRSDSNRMKYIVHQSKGKTAITHYENIYSSRGLTLVKLKIETGRTHQIRVHMTDKGHSLVGDDLYGKSSKRIKNLNLSSELKKKISDIDHPLLHSYSIKFSHPICGQEIFIKADLPADYSHILNELGFNFYER